MKTRTYEEWATLGLDSANNSMFIRWHDDEVGKTVIPMLGAEIGSDPIEESNLDAAMTLLEEHVASGHISEETVGRSGATWMRCMIVQAFDENGITQAWRDTVDFVLVPIEKYSILDEDLYAEYEYKNLQREYDYTFGTAAGLALELVLDNGSIEPRDASEEEVLEAIDLAVADGEELSDQQVTDLLWSYRRVTARAEGKPVLPNLTTLVNKLEKTGA